MTILVSGFCSIYLSYDLTVFTWPKKDENYGKSFLQCF